MLFDPEPCTTNDECRAAFGFGSVCAEDALCAPVEMHPRCFVYPDDLTFPVNSSETYLIGSVFDHSLQTHTGRYQSAQLALLQANTNDGLDGHQFGIVHCSNQEEGGPDELTKDEASVETAIWLADSVGVPAIVGPAASGRTEAVYNAVADNFGTLVISPSATSPSLTPLDGVTSTAQNPGLLWRTAPPDDLQGAAIAWDMLNNFDPAGLEVFRTGPSTNVAVIYQTGAYGEGLELVFSAELTSGGGGTVGFPFSDATARADGIAQAANGGFDEILFVSSDPEDAIAFFQGAASLITLEDTPVFLTDAARNTDVLTAILDVAPELLPHVRGTAPATPAGPVFDGFAVSYAAEFGGEDVSVLSFTAQSFDAGWLMVYGHAWASLQEDAIEGVNIARGLRKISSGTPVDIRAANWNEVKGQFGNGDSIDVFGASGPLDYDDRGETTATIEVWTINASGDDFIVVEAVDP